TVGQDILSFVDQAGITGAWDPLTGTLTLIGTATLVDYQGALRSVTYVNTSDNPLTLARTLAFSVSDGADASVPATRPVAVTAVNDAPELSMSAGSATYTENSPGVAIDPGLTLADVDSAWLASATVQISGSYAPGEDSLWFTGQLGITGAWNA